MQKTIIIILGVVVGLIPLLVAVFGFYLYFKTPQERNKHIGFRTKQSYYSHQAWLYSNKLTGIIFIILGIGLLVIYIPLLVLVYPKFNELVIILMCITAFLIIVSVLVVNFRAKKINEKLDNEKK